MTHRKHIVALDGEKTVEEALEFILSQSNSRFPIYDGDIDTVIGILHLRDAMKCYFNERLRNVPIKNLKRYVRTVNFVPEGKRIDKLFKEMKKKKAHMVIVLDEYGQTAGLITMEDVIEEIVGNIQDEYDNEEEPIRQLADGSYLADGMTELGDLEKLLDIEFENEDFGTINGFLIHSLEHIPSEEEKCEVEYSGYRFFIVSVNNNIIEKVRVEKI